mmetsp:Transcript_12488/g.30631  ORF Transcript_12488/g.30631 Transcript_12488/m.30631 type:complete len:341 (+) Transcript_12488:82-1104(+)|eukprot:CAMPEP_0206229262 /NCGR_PEP_ID=MMETSP0047_2-20121206/9603_1 /ASSEMBLY_ACC=CAM_ASM_000192 /TAXON_ID=195065 /ORGANISM="Chroomonas mesostigmatica_cf, Strain CCMP1168" /LENGTH=340 /DNA_ID=CAMNT_0053652549 /DNA_START=33 /DNA_END=1055 /DNA_ORIENTATION=+
MTTLAAQGPVSTSRSKYPPLIEELERDSPHFGGSMSHIFIAGGAAGLVSDAVMHPVDTVRTRLWLAGQGGATVYKSSADAIFSIARTEGVSSFYKGFSVVGMITPLAYGVYFASYEQSKRGISKLTGRGQDSASVHFVSGLLANITSQFVWTPMDIVKQRQQAAATPPFKSALHGLGTIYKEGGFTKGLMKGYWAAIWTYAPFSAIFFAIYEKWKTKLGPSYAKEGMLPGQEFYAAGGLFSGAIAAAMTAPADAIKTRMQCEPGASGGFVKDIIQSFRQEGFGVFTKGLMARVCWIAPGCAVTICAFETFKEAADTLLDQSLRFKEREEESKEGVAAPLV